MKNTNSVVTMFLSTYFKGSYKKTIMIFALLNVVMNGFSQTDTIYFKGGNKIICGIVSQNDTSVTALVNKEKVEWSRNLIERIGSEPLKTFEVDKERELFFNSIGAAGSFGIASMTLGLVGGAVMAVGITQNLKPVWIGGACVASISLPLAIVSFAKLIKAGEHRF